MRASEFDDILYDTFDKLTLGEWDEKILGERPNNEDAEDYAIDVLEALFSKKNIRQYMNAKNYTPETIHWMIEREIQINASFEEKSKQMDKEFERQKILFALIMAVLAVIVWKVLFMA